MPEPTGRGQSPAVAAGLSFLWPGLGQFFLGYRRAAAILALPALLAVLLVAIQLDQGAIMFAVSLWDPSYVAAIAALIIVLGIWRIAAVGHAFLTASRRRRSRSPELAFVAALMVVIVSMHGLFVAGTWAWYQTSVSVQNNGLVDDSSFKAAMAGRSSMPTPLPRDTSSFAPYAAGHTPTPAIWKPTNPNRITFLLVGFDSLSGRDGTANTDTMMLVSIDTSTDKVVMVSVPRDTSNFDLYYGGWVGPTFKLNTLWISAANPGFGSPDAPMKTLENEIGYLVGIPVDYYAAIDLYGLATMINTLGGIDFYNDQYIDDPATGITMGTGMVHLTGAEAMLYVRSREGAGGSDYKRAARQQTLLVALEHKIASPSGIGSLPTLLSMADRVIDTDFPLSSAHNYVKAAQNLSSIENCVLGPPYSYHPDTSSTAGTWTSRLDMKLVADLSVEMFGQDSRYYGLAGIKPVACGDE